MKPLCVLFLASTVLATDTAYTFPAKSVNLNAAYTTDWFAAHTLGSGTGNIHPAMDAHAVHGIQLADGGYILTGKALEADGSTVTEAFATKLSATGSIVWGWKSGIAGKDAANAAAQLPNGEVLIAGTPLSPFFARRKRVGPAQTEQLYIIIQSNSNSPKLLFL